MIYGLLGATVGLIIFTIVIGLGDWWWKSSFAFNIGTLLPLVEKKYKGVKTYAKEYNFIILLFCLLVICSVPNVFHLGNSKILKLLMILLTTILPIFLYVAFKKIMFPRNRVLHFLGSISYEIYLLHGIILSLIFNTFHTTNSILCVILIYLVTIIISWLIFKTSRLIK